MADVEPQVEEQVDSPDSEMEAASEATEVSQQPEGTEGQDNTGNWWDVSSIKDEGAVKRIKAIQPEFQKLSERVKEQERNLIEKQQQLQQLANEARRVLQDPEAYRQTRRQLGIEQDVVPQPAAQEFTLKGVETVQDLERNLATHISQMNQAWEAKLRNELAKQQYQFEQRVGMVAEPVAKERWENAMANAKSKFGPEFAAKEAEVVSKIVNGPYRAMYGQNGIDEKALIEKVFLAEFPDAAMKAMRQKSAATHAQKKTAVTSKPTQGKGGKGVSPKAGSVAAQLAELRENGFSFEE